MTKIVSNIFLVLTGAVIQFLAGGVFYGLYYLFTAPANSLGHGQGIFMLLAFAMLGLSLYFMWRAGGKIVFFAPFAWACSFSWLLLMPHIVSFQPTPGNMLAIVGAVLAVLSMIHLRPLPPRNYTTS